jgi:hypothetical protein
VSLAVFCSFLDVYWGVFASFCYLVLAEVLANKVLHGRFLAGSLGRGEKLKTASGLA